MTWVETCCLLPSPSLPPDFMIKVFENTIYLSPFSGLFSVALRLICCSKEKCFKNENPQLLRWILWIWLPGPTHVHLLCTTSFCPAGENPDENYLCTKILLPLEARQSPFWLKDLRALKAKVLLQSLKGRMVILNAVVSYTDLTFYSSVSKRI